MKCELIIFDLDGTLTDSGPSIMKAADFALNEMQVEHSFEELRSFVGPPLKISMQKYFNESEKLEKAMRLFEQYDDKYGLSLITIYKGIPNLLKELKSQGVKLAVATSKPQPIAEMVLEHFNLTRYFDYIAGTKNENTDINKFEVLMEALQKLMFIDKRDNVVLIGDKKYDARGAELVRIQCIGAGYGYCEEGELEKAGVNNIAGNVSELKNILYKMCV